MLPHWIGRDIGDDDGLPPIGGRAAWARFGTDGRAFNRLSVGIWQTGAAPSRNRVPVSLRSRIEQMVPLNCDLMR